MKKPYTCINQMQHLHACSSLMFWPLMVWISIPESMHCFNQFVYAGCAAKSVKAKPRSESWLDNSDEAPSQCFKEKKLIPDFLPNMIFNLCPLKYFLKKINQVFRFRNQSLSIQCKDVLFKMIWIRVWQTLHHVDSKIYSIPMRTLECSHLGSVCVNMLSLC